MIFTKINKKFSSQLFEFIQKYESLINENDFQQLYQRSQIENIDTRELTLLLYAGGLDPLETMIRIPENFCYSTPELVEIRIPEGIITIDESAFYDCNNITEITLPKSVTAIYNWAIAGMDKLEEIRIEGKLTHLEPLAFHQLPSLAWIRTVPENIELLKKYIVGIEHGKVKLAEI